MMPSKEHISRLQPSKSEDFRVDLSWKGYDRLFALDGTLFTNRLTPATLAVIHPGFYTYYTYPDKNPPQEYVLYQHRMRAVIQEALLQEWSVLCWVSADHRKGALDAMHIDPTDDRVLLIPNKAKIPHPILDTELLGISDLGVFWDALQQKVQHLILCGEYYMPIEEKGCVLGVKRTAQEYIPNVTVLTRATFNPRGIVPI